MTKINDLTLNDLIRVAEDVSLTDEQRRKIKIYTLGKLKEATTQEGLTEKEKQTLRDKIIVYTTDVWGVQDIGYPYIKVSLQEGQCNASDTKTHVDMYCSSEPLFAN